MPRRRFIFDPPERFVAGTIGEPGDRTFFLQARDGGRVVSVVLEKVQVAVLAERLGRAPRRARPARRRRRPTPRGGDSARAADTGPLDEPLNEAFRAGSLTLGWDGDAERVLVEARAQDEDGEAIDPDEDDDEDEDGPDLLRVRLTADAARSFVERATPRRASGRLPCPLCGDAARPAGPHLPAPQRPLRQLGGRPMLDPATTLAVLREGDIEVVGRIVGSRNNALLVTRDAGLPGPGAADRHRRDLQADHRRAPARRLPGRHADPARGRRLARVRGDRLGHRPADDPARRPVRRGHGPGLRRGRPGRRRRGDGRSATTRACAGWRRSMRR